MLGFLLELAIRSMRLVLPLLGETPGTILVAVVSALLLLALKAYRAGGSTKHRWNEVKRRWAEEIRDVLVVWAVLATSLSFYNLFWVVIPTIRKAVQLPAVGHPTLKVPDFAFSKSAQARVTIRTASQFGNIGDRAVELSQEIMEDLWIHGWASRRDSPIQMPKGFVPIAKMPAPGDVQGNLRWERSRSSYFRFRFLKRAVDLRNELAQLHLRDRRLDEFMKDQRKMEEVQREAKGTPIERQMETDISPPEIEEVAEGLRILGDEANSLARAEYPGIQPVSLNFSTERIAPDRKEFPYRILVTISTKTIINSGYVAVVFAENDIAVVGCDLRGIRVVEAPEDTENDELKSLLGTNSGQIYAFQIESIPFVPNDPIHVVASNKDGVRVISVTYFRE